MIIFAFVCIFRNNRGKSPLNYNRRRAAERIPYRSRISSTGRRIKGRGSIVSAVGDVELSAPLYLFHSFSVFFDSHHNLSTAKFIFHFFYCFIPF